MRDEVERLVKVLGDLVRYDSQIKRSEGRAVEPWHGAEHRGSAREDLSFEEFSSGKHLKPAEGPSAFLLLPPISGTRRQAITA